MKIQESSFYTGCALAQIAQFSDRVLIKKLKKLPDYFEINQSSNVLIRHATNAGSKWKFTLQRKTLEEAEYLASSNRFYLALVCGDKVICLLTQSDLASITDQETRKPLVITVILEKNNRMTVHSEEWSLHRPVPVNAFPKMLFEKAKPDSQHFSWPELSTINVYDTLPINKFTSDDLKFDLSDLLINSLDVGERRTKYIGISVLGKDLHDWLETEISRIENRIEYLFEFEGCVVEIKRVTEGICFMFEKEFFWEVDYWFDDDREGSDDADENYLYP